ncbi:MAG: molybdopterin-dependent oxidoreductase [Candidatus Sumerlaeaceae bacterium]|nr:molybdopterin-dependent oxidoreductase [Candidatus Sumerlaeaceae bacterium]
MTDPRTAENKKLDPEESYQSNQVLNPDDWLPEEDAKRLTSRTSRRGFLIAAGAGIAAVSGWQWLRTRPNDDGIPWPLRKVLNLNGNVAGALSPLSRLSPEYSKSQARMPRANGTIGLENELGIDWALNVFGLTDPAKPITLSLSDIQALPRVEMVTRLCCIEGWSEVVHWAGARVSDLAARFPLATADARLLSSPHPNINTAAYLSAMTPDGEYFVGLDMKSALHPQTLLCYEMNGQPLEPIHGAPLRLTVPVKYGIKSLKCVGALRFTNQRPPDYWAMRGYDYYAGL